MKLIFHLLFVVFFVALFSVEADKSNGENESVDVLDQAYYGLESSDNADDQDSDSGEEADTEEETTTISARGRGRPQHRGRGRGRHNQRAKAWGKPKTPVEKFELICRAIQRKSNILQSKKMAIKMRRVDPEVREKLQASLTARTTAMTECCLLNGTAGIRCAENIRTQRLTRVCNGEEPLNIWSLLKGRAHSNQHSEATSKCCELKGEERNSCFLSAKQKQFGRFHGKQRKDKDHKFTQLSSS